MTRRGYKHQRSDAQFSIRGEYAHNLQYVYSRECPTRDGTVVDLVYFAVDILKENLVIGLYRENTEIENGLYLNVMRTMSLDKFTRENLESELDRLITPVGKSF